MPIDQGILVEPPQPGLLKVCPKCRRWFVLEQSSEVVDSARGKIREFHCKCCGEVVTFADRHPPGVL